MPDFECQECGHLFSVDEDSVDEDSVDEEFEGECPKCGSTDVDVYSGE